MNHDSHIHSACSNMTICINVKQGQLGIFKIALLHDCLCVKKPRERMACISCLASAFDYPGGFRRHKEIRRADNEPFSGDKFRKMKDSLHTLLRQFYDCTKITVV